MSHNASKKWYNNGVIEGMYDNPPEGWERGRLVKTKKDRKFDIIERVRQSNFIRPKRKS